MFDVNIKYKEIKITSIEEEDVKGIHHWCNKQNVFIDGDKDTLEFKELYQRFLEYYLSECEMFLKITKSNKLIGIFRGRIEFKNPNKVWISCFTLEEKYLKSNEGEEILNKILLYFSKKFAINNFLFGVLLEEKDVINIFKNNGFRLERFSNDFFMEKGKWNNAIILKKEKIYEA